MKITLLRISSKKDILGIFIKNQKGNYENKRQIQYKCFILDFHHNF